MLNRALNSAGGDCDSRRSTYVAELERANEKLEEFVHVACHDLRSPLRAMMSLVGWVRDDLQSAYGELPDNIASDLSEITAQGARMAKLLSDLLDFSRTGNPDELTKKFDPRGIIDDCIDISDVPKGFSVAIADEMPWVECSPVEFSIVIRNLISNSVKHHDRATGRIEIDAWSEGAVCFFRVRDDGPGIQSQHSAQIFEMFKTSDSNRGHGIGLGLVKKIVTQRGGSVRVEPNPAGRGSDFIFSFPLDTGAGKAGMLKAAPPRTAPSDDIASSRTDA